MGIFFRKSVKVAPGVRLNFSKRGTSLSVGPKGAKINYSKRGTYVTTSIPGSGIYSRTKISGGKNSDSALGRSPRVKDSDIVKHDPAAVGCGVFAASFVCSLFGALMAHNWVVIPIVSGIGLLLAFIPSIIALGGESVEAEVPTREQEFSDDVMTDVESAKPFTEQLNSLLDSMDKAQTQTELVDIHLMIVNLMNGKLRGKRILFNGMSFDDAMAQIEAEYQERLKEVNPSVSVVYTDKDLYQSVVKSPISNDEQEGIRILVQHIKDSTTMLEAMNTYEKAKAALKPYKDKALLIIDGMGYEETLEMVHQTYFDKCKELHQ